MFAYDYDRADATLGEETALGGEAELGRPRRAGDPRAHARLRHHPDPGRPRQLDDLSHAYYLFVQRVGHDIAGNVLQYVPWQLDPQPTFVQVRNAFVRMASQLYPHDSPADADTFPEVTEAAILAHDTVGICFGECR